MLTELDRLAAANPDQLTPSLAVPAEEKLRMLEAILSSPAAAGGADSSRGKPLDFRPRRSARLVFALAAVTTVATVTGVVPLPGLSSTPPPANAALQALAVTAGYAPSDAVGPRQFRHIVVHLNYNGEHTGETWIAADGRSWRWDTYMGPREYYAFPPMQLFARGDPSPTFLASLPTSPGALSRYLRQHASGSQSTDDAVFTAVGDMLRAGLAGPQLRAAAVRVIEGLPHIGTQVASDLLGRPALEITYKDPHDGPWSLLFDRDTAALLGEEQRPGYRVAYTEDIADSVPADVLAHAHMPKATPDGEIQPSAQPAPPTS